MISKLYSFFKCQLSYRYAKENGETSNMNKNLFYPRAAMFVALCATVGAVAAVTTTRPDVAISSMGSVAEQDQLNLDGAELGGWGWRERRQAKVGPPRSRN